MVIGVLIAGLKRYLNRLILIKCSYKNVNIMSKFIDPLGRKPGEALNPKRHDVNVLQMRKDGNPRIWASIWQQTPRASEGTLINPKWFPILTRKEMPPTHEIKMTARGWDLAYTQKQVSKGSPDYTVGLKLLVWKPQNDTEFNFIIADVRRWQTGWHATKNKIYRTAKEDGLKCHIIAESGGAQKAAYTEIENHKKLKKYRVKASIPDRDKVSRAQPWIDKAEVGQIYILEANWNRALLAEFAGFDRTLHDDQVDAMSIVYNYFASKFRKKSVTSVPVTGLYT
jgi:predicted phage terminase large subunit-like protein